MVAHLISVMPVNVQVNSTLDALDVGNNNIGDLGVRYLTDNLKVGC